MAKFTDNIEPQTKTFQKNTDESHVQTILKQGSDFFSAEFLKQHTENLSRYPIENIHPGTSDTKELLQKRESIMWKMQKNYPGYPIFNMNIMGYRLDERSPDEIHATGGFLPKENDVYITNRFDKSYHRGLVGFSLLPGAASLLLVQDPEDILRQEDIQQKKPYMYAVPVDISYVVQGDTPQILAPALTLPNWWCAKLVEAIKEDGTIILGASQGRCGDMVTAYDEQFETFLKGEVEQPKCVDRGTEDHAPIFQMEKSALSQEFEKIRKEKSQSISI